MTTTILKFSITSLGITELSVPEDFTPTTAQLCRGYFTLWGHGDLEKPTKTLTVFAQYTGESIPPSFVHLDTIQTHNGFVLTHIYVKI